MILLMHFVFNLIVLVLIELEVYTLFDWCPCIRFRSAGAFRQGPKLIKDDDVITEENQRKQEIIDQAKNPTPGIAAMPMPGAPKGSGGSSMDQGGDEAIPKIKYSPYFDSYAETSQF